MNEWLAVAAGAALGAAARHLMVTALQTRLPTGFPWALVVVNSLGSAVLGLLSAAVVAGQLSPAWGWAWGTGWCGAFTTFSAFGHELVDLIEAGRRRRAILAASVGVLGAVAAVWLGAAVGAAIGGP